MEAKILIFGIVLFVALNSAQGEEPSVAAREDVEYRTLLNDFKSIAADKEAEEAANIFYGMIHATNTHNRTEAKESFIHLLVFAVQNKVSASRDELCQALDKCINESDLLNSEEQEPSIGFQEESEGELLKYLSSDDVRKVKEFTEAIPHWEPGHALQFMAHYINYAVPNKMKITTEQIKAL